MIIHRRSLVLEEAIVQARKSGMLVKQITGLVNRSQSVVDKVLRIYGLTKKRPPKVPLDVSAQIRTLRAQGIQLKDIAGRFGISQATACKHAKRGDQHV